MSRWGKPTKNKKHRDPRYFLTEQDLFSPADGSLNKEYAIQLFVKAADGDKEAAKQLYASADIISKEYKFSPADGTKIEQSAIAKAYGLNDDSQGGNFEDNLKQIQQDYERNMQAIDDQWKNFMKKQQQEIDQYQQQKQLRKEQEIARLNDEAEANIKEYIKIQGIFFKHIQNTYQAAIDARRPTMKAEIKILKQLDQEYKKDYTRVKKEYLEADPARLEGAEKQLSAAKTLVWQAKSHLRGFKRVMAIFVPEEKGAQDE